MHAHRAHRDLSNARDRYKDHRGCRSAVGENPRRAWWPNFRNFTDQDSIYGQHRRVPSPRYSPEIWVEPMHWHIPVNRVYCHSRGRWLGRMNEPSNLIRTRFSFGFSALRAPQADLSIRRSVFHQKVPGCWYAAKGPPRRQACAA